MRSARRGVFTVRAFGTFATFALMVFLLAVTGPITTFQSEFHAEQSAISDKTVSAAPIILANDAGEIGKCGPSGRCTPVDIPGGLALADILHASMRHDSAMSQFIEIWYTYPLLRIPIGIS